MLFWVMPQNTLDQSVCMIFTFDLFDVLILIPGGGGRGGGITTLYLFYLQLIF